MNVYEEMRALQVGPWRIRLWIALDGPLGLTTLLPHFPAEAVRDTRSAGEVIVRIEQWCVSTHQPVAAVEVLDESGDGKLVYFDWP